MVVGPAGWPGRLAQGVVLGLLVVAATLFQVALPRLRAEWIAASFQPHVLLLQGAAGSPWQYRLLSDVLFQGLLDLVSWLHLPNPPLVAFLVFRAVQATAIFGLAAHYFRQLQLGAWRSTLGLLIVGVGMLLGQVLTNWQLDTYTEVALYLLVAICVVERRWWPIVPLSLLAALNRETGVLIPLLPLAAVGLRAPRRVYSVVALSLVSFVVVSVALHLVLPDQAGSTRVATDQLVGTLRMRPPATWLALGLGVVALLGALGLPICSTLLGRLFWLIVPVWSVLHWWGNLEVTPLAFLVPLALVLVPCALQVLQQVLRPSATGLSPSDLLQRLGLSTQGGLGLRWSVVMAVAAVYLLGPLAAALVRTTYPFPLERMEGPVLQEVRRISLGLPVYTAPTLQFIPLLYTPLYFFVSAALAALLGISFVPLRIVSLLASLGSAGLIYRLVARDAPGRLAGLLAAGLFLGSTQLGLTDLNPARVDALCVCLVLASLDAARQAQVRPTHAGRFSLLSGALLALAILTKQTASLLAVVLVLLLLERPRARLAPCLAGLGAVLGVAAAALWLGSGGWAGFYLVMLPRNHGLDWSIVGQFWTEDTLPHFAIAAVLGGIFSLSARMRCDWAALRFHGLAVAGLLGMAWVGSLNWGGGANSLPSAYAGLSMLFGLGFQRGVDLLLAHRPNSRALALGLAVAVGGQLAAVAYTPDQALSLRASTQAGDRLVAAIGALPGPVFAPDLGEFQLRAGKGDQPYPANWQELIGFYGGVPLPPGAQWMGDLHQALRSRQFTYVLVDPEGTATVKDIAMGDGYVFMGLLLPRDDPFYLWRTRASPSPMVYVPIELAHASIMCAPPFSDASLAVACP